jgi:hypothetical protein
MIISILEWRQAGFQNGFVEEECFAVSQVDRRTMWMVRREAVSWISKEWIVLVDDRRYLWVKLRQRKAVYKTSFQR